ncbi:MAG: hypothetical protein M1823_005778 [Watsoniomyces obsoletus]|nr:MAG: hypothetical protein M1823_005778 [Watsoniomyces obsoletus]
MQIRCVPEEELGVDATGRRLPFALLHQEDRRKHVEETGPFGKSRRGTSRTKPTATPKKEDPHLAYFADALRYDQGRAAEEDSPIATPVRTRAASQTSLYAPAAGSGVTGPEGTSAPVSTAPPTQLQQEPTEVMLYGFKPSLQHCAIQRYESISRGYICEEYPREPPMQLKRFKTVSSYPVGRVLSPKELEKKNAYAGGESWIKVTFDSGASAERVVAASPQSINGFWVHAELYRGMPPHRDVPLPNTDAGGRPEPVRGSGSRSSQPTLIPPGMANAPRLSSTLPRNFPGYPNLNTTENSSSMSSSTVSSATATGYASAAAKEVPPETSELEVYRKIPTARKIKLRPAEEAVLPTRSTGQWLTSYIPFASLLQGPVFGDKIPRLEDGRFNYAEASLYWKLWYWLDWMFHTDFCGLKDE